MIPWGRSTMTLASTSRGHKSAAMSISPRYEIDALSVDVVRGPAGETFAALLPWQYSGRENLVQRLFKKHAPGHQDFAVMQVNKLRLLIPYSSGWSCRDGSA
jgi:hypothetical protein